MEKTGRIHSLDSVRGISSVIVIIFHCLISFQAFYNAYTNQQFDSGFVRAMTDSPLHILWAGPEAVLVFFVLSGFVLALTFLRQDTPAYGRYIVKRLCRIYIPYIVMILSYMILITCLADFRNIDVLSPSFNSRWDHPVTLKAVISAVLMLDYDIGNANGVIWSLIHEMRISLIFPVIMFFVKKTNWKLFVPLGFGICILANYLSVQYAQTQLTGNAQMVVQSLGNTLYYIPFFIMGAGLAKHRDSICLRLKRTRPITKIILLAVSLVLIIFKWVFYPLQAFSVSLNAPKVTAIAENWITGAGIVLLFAVVLSSAKAEWLLTRKIPLWLGKVSYSLYLVHLIPIMIGARYLSAVIPLPVSIMLAPILALPLAGLVYKFVERPAMNLGRRLTSKSRE